MSSAENHAGSAFTALRNLAIAVVVLGAIFAAYTKYVGNSKVIKDRSKAAIEHLAKDNPSEYAEAAKDLDEALAVRGEDPFAVGARAMVAAIRFAEYGIASEKDVASKYVAKANELGLNTKERFLAEGLYLAGSGKPAEAEKTLLTLVDRGITPAEVIQPLGFARARQGKTDAARSDLKQAAEREWRTPRYTSLYADAFFDAGDFVNAAATYRKSIEASPAVAPHVRSTIGKARADAGRGENVDEALATLDALLAKTGDDELPPALKARALTGRAEALLAAAKVADAESAANTAITAQLTDDPAAAFAHYALGVALAKQKKAGALEAIQKAISTQPTVSRFYFQGALALAGAGKGADGQALFDLYLKSNKETDTFHVARGDFLLAAGKIEDAVKAFEAAIAANQVNADAWYKKGYALQRQGAGSGGGKRGKRGGGGSDMTGALAAYEKAVGIRERFPEVYRQVGLIYLDQDPRSSKATEQFVKALQFYKDQKASKAVFAAFIEEVRQKYVDAKLKGNAEAWVKEAGALAK